MAHTAKVEIYTNQFCGYCSRAKNFLNKKGVEFTEYDVGFGGETRAEMRKRADGRTSVPQIFIDGVGIGGCDEMFELDLDDELDPMLGIEG
ncbi:MAG: glutaredoxin 3 [Alphaproteobacteria bacterium]